MTLTDHARDHHARQRGPTRLAAGGAMIAALATVLAACGGGGNNQTGSGEQAGSPGQRATTAPGGRASSATSSAPSSFSMAPAAGLSQRDKHAIRALRTAAGKVPGGQPYDLETEHYQGKNVWDIKVASDHHRPYELYVSQDGRNVVHQSRHKSDDDTAKALKAKVTFSDALSTAATREHGRLSEAEIDRDRGPIVWTATFKRSSGGEYEVIINAKNGKIIRIKKENGGG